jgi:uncharacterized protein
MNIDEKFSRLQDVLLPMQRVAVAYSGGIDSTLLLKVAHDLLGDAAVAITAVSASLAEDERDNAQAIAAWIGVKQYTIESQETDDPQYLANTPMRCFFCKNEVYQEIFDYAHNLGIDTVIDGTNFDDQGDHRPGRMAARQHGVRSPLLEAGLNKADIRQLAKWLNLPNWDKPAAACLSSRIPYGTTITLEMLSQVEQAERALHQLGFRQLRVRHHGEIARIEVEPADFPAVMENQAAIVAGLKSCGYQYITLDLAGYRSGSLNDMLTDKQRLTGEYGSS